MIDIERLARDAGFATALNGETVAPYPGSDVRPFIARFANAVLEAAAVKCENTWEADIGGDEESSGFPQYAENSARAVRAMKVPTP